MSNLEAINEAKSILEAANFLYKNCKGNVSEEREDELFELVLDAEDAFVEEVKKETPKKLLDSLTNAALEFKFKQGIIQRLITNQAF